MENYDEKKFNVDYKGWINRKRRSYSDVKWLLSENGMKLFEKFAKNALYGEKTIIDGISIECVPSMYEIICRTRSYIEI